MRVLALAFVCSAFVLSGCGGTGSSSSPTPTPAASAPGGGGNSGGSSAGSGSGGSGTAGSGSGGSSSGSGSGSSGTGSSGTGGATSTVAIAFAGAGPHELSGTNEFHGISVDSSGKVSTTPGSPYRSGVNLVGPMTSLAGANNLLFVNGYSSSNTNSMKITSFRSDANGSLTPLTSTPADGALSLVLDAAGKYLYVSAMADPAKTGFSSPTVYAFIVDQNSGALAPVAGSPWTLSYGDSGGEMNTFGVSPDESYVCAGIVIGRRNEAIECYPKRSDGTIDPNNFHPVTHSTLPQDFTFSSDGSHVLALNEDNNMVQSFPLPGFSGTSEVSSGGINPNGVALDPQGHWLAVTNSGSGNVAIIAVGAQGSLAPTATVTPAGTGPFEVAFSHSGNYLFVTASEGTLVFSFNSSTGALTPLNAANPAPGTGNVASL